MDLNQRMAILNANKKKLKSMYPELREDSGIYILTRNENDFNYAYVGQAKHILTRLAEHMMGRSQHIDRSIYMHGWKTKQKTSGWEIKGIRYCPKEQLDAWEQYFIKLYHKAGCQLHNKTVGGQGEGHTAIAEFLPKKSYHDGLKQGRENLRRELAHIVDKYFNIELKKDNKLSQKALIKFYDLLKKEKQTEEEKAE